MFQKRLAANGDHWFGQIAQASLEPCAHAPCKNDELLHRGLTDSRGWPVPRPRRSLASATSRRISISRGNKETSAHHPPSRATLQCSGFSLRAPPPSRPPLR